MQWNARMVMLYAQYQEILKEPKVLFFPPPEAKKANNSNFLYYETDVFRESLEIIPQLRFRYDVKVGGYDTNAKYSLHFIGDKCDRRVFQVEIYNFSCISHREPDGSNWFGPHLYYNGNSRRTTAKIDTVSVDNSYWLKRFCRHTNISIKEAKGPFQRALL